MLASTTLGTTSVTSQDSSSMRQSASTKASSRLDLTTQTRRSLRTEHHYSATAHTMSTMCSTQSRTRSIMSWSAQKEKNTIGRLSSVSASSSRISSGSKLLRQPRRRKRLSLVATLTLPRVTRCQTFATSTS